jgi:hypothetical protein
MQGIASDGLIEAYRGKIMSKERKINLYVFMGIMIPLSASMLIPLLGLDKSLLASLIAVGLASFLGFYFFFAAFTLHRDSVSN